jgi:hypothetical protein
MSITLTEGRLGSRVSTENEETETRLKEEESGKADAESSEGISSQILPWVMAALAAGLFFAVPGTTTSIKIVLFIAMAAAVVAAGIKVRRTLRLSGKRSVSILALLTVPATLLGAAFGWQLGSHHGSRSSTGPQPITAVGSLLKFSDKSYATLPYCRSYYGIGVIPRGDSLLIFDSPADSSWDLKQPVEYTFHGVADEQNGGWEIRNVDILGPSNNGAHAVIFGILENDQDAQFVKQIEVYSRSSGSYWRTQALPLGLGQIKPLQVVVSNSTAC